MTFEWVDKKDGDYIDPNDINKVAKGVQSLEKLIDDTKSSSVQKTKNDSSIYATNEIGEAITVRYTPNEEADTVAYRDENGNIGVGSPVQEQDAANKQYVDSAKIGLKNSVANALKGSVSGEAVRVDDVSPLSHDMAVKVGGVEDVSAVKVKKYGKNLINEEWLHNVDNWETNALNRGYLKFSLPTGIYTFSASENIDGEAYLYLGKSYDDGETWSQEIILQDTHIKDITVAVQDNMLLQFFVYPFNKLIGDTEILKVQAEWGSIATEYEPYIEPTEYTVNEDGTVDGVTALYPTTTLMTDTAGAIIECEYNRDINKAFAELQQAIISMGGNV